MDIRIDHSLPNKPEVLEIAAKLGAPVGHVVGGLVLCWLWTDQVSVAGSLPHSPEVVDQVSTMPGLAKAMEEVGWLVREDQGFCLPRISRYTGDGRTTRERRLDKQSKAKSQRRTKTGQFAPKGVKNPTLTDGPPTIGGHLPSLPSVSRPPQPGPARPDPNQPKPEHKQTAVDVGDLDAFTDFTGETIPPARAYALQSLFGEEIALVFNSIPSSRRRQPVKIRRAIAAAIDRGVAPDHLSQKICDYYNSDEGAGEYATWPSNWSDHERYDEDPSAWERSTPDKSNLKEIL